MLDIFMRHHDLKAHYALEVANMLSRGRAVIAGGYVRDRILGQSPKDIDLYIGRSGNPEVFANAFAGALRVLGQAARLQDPVRLGGEIEYDNNGWCVYRMAAVPPAFRRPEVAQGPMEIDLVFIHGNPEAGTVFPTFDIGLCEAMIHPERGIITSNRFEEDAADRTLTIRNSVGAEYDEVGNLVTTQRTENHLQRLLRKYPGYTVQEDGTEPGPRPQDLGLAEVAGGVLL